MLSSTSLKKIIFFLKKVAEKFGRLKNMLYLCSVKLKQQVIMESIRKYIYSWSEEGKVNLINELMSYIEQSEIGEQIGYMEELNEVKSNWWNLIHSGIYHDAIGKVVDAQFRGTFIIVNVAEEY